MIIAVLHDLFKLLHFSFKQFFQILTTLLVYLSNFVLFVSELLLKQLDIFKLSDQVLEISGKLLIYLLTDQTTEHVIELRMYLG